ncbi:DUF4435 domain-containing protein [Niallia sp. FSL R7-0271]|uniref:DUF4435 domain-containing protein n=1 Tax=Niallia sp. FSL R7-0271 TaxID=2921678 RepID=UPI0030FC370E
MKQFKPDQLELEDHIAELEFYLYSQKRVLIVEGKSDLLFFNVLLTTTNNEVIPFVIGEKSKNSSREEIIKLFDYFPLIQNHPNVLGIVDKDLNELKPLGYKNLKQTEFYDLDCYYIFGANFLSFIIELVCHDKIIKKLGFNPGKDIEYFREFLLISLLPLTKMRFINSQLKIPFNNILKKSPIKDRKERHKKLSKFLNDKFSVEINSFHKYLTDSGNNKGLTLENLIQEIENVDIESKRQVTNGHDLISIITAIIKTNRNDFDDVKTEESLRLSMNINTFDEFELTKSVKEWILHIPTAQEKVSS